MENNQENVLGSKVHHFPSLRKQRILGLNYQGEKQMCRGRQGWEHYLWMDETWMKTFVRHTSIMSSADYK